MISEGPPRMPRARPPAKFSGGRHGPVRWRSSNPGSWIPKLRLGYALLRTARPLREPDARSTAVFVDKLYSAFLKRANDRLSCFLTAADFPLGGLQSLDCWNR